MCTFPKNNNNCFALQILIFTLCVVYYKKKNVLFPRRPLAHPVAARARGAHAVHNAGCSHQEEAGGAAGELPQAARGAADETTYTHLIHTHICE